MEINGEPVIYQLRVVLEGISPLIWRRLLVPGDYSIGDLHFILQIAFDWDDWNLHRFFIHVPNHLPTAQMSRLIFADAVDKDINIIQNLVRDSLDN